MEKRVALELRGRNPSQVKELNLDNCRSTNIVGLTDEYVNLEILSLNNVNLTTLKGFPVLPNLRKLELSDNRISNGLNFLNGCKKLTHLNLSGNKIRDLETLTPLGDLESLRNLDLFNNEITSIEDYRAKVFALHPKIRYLDGFDKADREAESSDEEDEMNGNNDSDEEDLDIDLGPLVIQDDESQRPAENNTSLPMLLYTIYGFIFHMGYLLKKSEEDEEDDDEDEDISLRAVYNENLDEQSSESSMFEGSGVEDVEDEEEDVEEDGEGDADERTVKVAENGQDKEDGSPEESTRGKKRKHDDEDEN